MDNSNKIKAVLPLVIFMSALYALDAFRIYMGFSLYIDRFLLWCIAPFLFIKFYLRQNPFEYLKLNTNIKKGIVWGAAISSIHAALYVAFWYLKNGTISINWNGDIKGFIEVVLMVGLIEEVPFRGLALNYLRNIYSFKTANIVSSLLFVIEHIPYFIAWGYFSWPLPKLIYEFVFLFAFGLLWGFLLKKTNSLWPCMIHHSVNNFLASMVR